MINQRPKISVITVCLNASDALEQTIKSVLNQSYKNIEYIIIDGGSKDETIKIIKKYHDRITHWVSEPDQGVYDAMNKGTYLAQGQWLIYLNAGDLFSDPNVLDAVFSENIEPKIGMIYGDQIRLLKHFTYYQKPLPLSSLWRGIICSHQCMFIRKDIAKKHPYNSRLKFLADFDFIYNLYQQKIPFLYKPICISKGTYGGICEIKKWQFIREKWAIIHEHHLMSIKVFLYHYVLAVLEALIAPILKALPSRFLYEKLVLIKKQVMRDITKDVISTN